MLTCAPKTVPARKVSVKHPNPAGGGDTADKAGDLLQVRHLAGTFYRIELARAQGA